VSNHIEVNRPRTMRLRDAKRLVATGRAEWTIPPGNDQNITPQIKVKLNHEANQDWALDGLLAARGYDYCETPAHAGDAPDRDRMRLTDPERYAAWWHGKLNARQGSGALGHGLSNSAIRFVMERAEIAMEKVTTVYTFLADDLNMQLWNDVPQQELAEAIAGMFPFETDADLATAMPAMMVIAADMKSLTPRDTRTAAVMAAFLRVKQVSGEPSEDGLCTPRQDSALRELQHRLLELSFPNFQ
jgi:hypothetical protein